MVGVGIVAHGIADVVVQTVHQAAVVDGQHLVEGTGDMEADGVHVRILGAAGYLVAGEPAFVAALKLHLVAILAGLGRAQDGAERRKLHLADARELVEHLALLHPQLFGIGQDLPLAAAADTEMGAHRRHTQTAGLHQAHHLGLAVVLALLAHLHVDHVARHYERHEDHLLVDMGYAFALGGAVFYLHILVYR